MTTLSEEDEDVTEERAQRDQWSRAVGDIGNRINCDQGNTQYCPGTHIYIHQQ